MNTYWNRFNIYSAFQDLQGLVLLVIGLEESDLQTLELNPTVTVPLAGEITVSDDEEFDEEENVQVGGLIDFIGSLTFTT